ncbi:hypothetical protein V5O48_000851 [Marasmius crinis-equi]|uniref:Xylosidase/arabinosidase n=1 Tax=Marasmius crinis-equi TaxID=585013 RepID=A0ABR3G010_9AGAR
MDQHSYSASSSHGRSSTGRDSHSTIQNKFLVGYRGWFACPGDGLPLTENGWSGWFNPAGELATDLWPDVSEYPPSELFPARPLVNESEECPLVFSSRSPGTVRRHFEWMAKHGIDGAFLHRKLSQCNPNILDGAVLRWRDNIGRLVQEASEVENRVFGIMYDLSGIPPDQIQCSFQSDWTHLIQDERVLDSPSYLREEGKPVIGLWGFGFANSNHDPETLRAIVKRIRNETPGGAYIVAGAPACWRTGDGDADSNPGFLDAWLNEFDAISPWTVGAYGTEGEADAYAEGRMKEDIALLKGRNSVGKWRRVDYIPVGHNSSEGRAGFNRIKRNGGHFLWKQIGNACDKGARTIYGATWDELSAKTCRLHPLLNFVISLYRYDGGTALMPAVAKNVLLPDSHRYPMMSLDVDGYDVPSDWLSGFIVSPARGFNLVTRYMRICGIAVEVLRREFPSSATFPFQEVSNYWRCRPRHQGQADLSTYVSAFDGEEQAPPPYSERGSQSPTSSPQACAQPASPPLRRPYTSASRPLPPLPLSVKRASLSYSDPQDCHKLSNSINRFHFVSGCSSTNPTFQSPTTLALLTPSVQPIHSFPPSTNRATNNPRDLGPRTDLQVSSGLLPAPSQFTRSTDLDRQSQQLEGPLRFAIAPVVAHQQTIPRSNRDLNPATCLPSQSTSEILSSSGFSSYEISEGKHGLLEFYTGSDVDDTTTDSDPYPANNSHTPLEVSGYPSGLNSRGLSKDSASRTPPITLRWMPEDSGATEIDGNSKFIPDLAPRIGDDKEDLLERSFGSRLAIAVPDKAQTLANMTALDSNSSSPGSFMACVSDSSGTTPLLPGLLSEVATCIAEDVSGTSTPNKAKRSDTIRSFVRRLRRRDGNVEMPPVPTIPTNLLSLDTNRSSSSVSLSTKDEAKRKKDQARERREELAQELKRRGTKAASVPASALKPTVNRPSNRDDVSFFAIPDGGFSM